MVEAEQLWCYATSFFKLNSAGTDRREWEREIERVRKGRREKGREGGGREKIRDKIILVVLISREREQGREREKKLTLLLDCPDTLIVYPDIV
jgi:hypothetical protein